MTSRGTPPDDQDPLETLAQFSASDPARPPVRPTAEMTPPPTAPREMDNSPSTRDPSRTPDDLVAETVPVTPAGSGSTSGFSAALGLSDKPRPGQIIFDRYKVERELGEGGMGSVWLVRHLELDADRALKLIVAEIAADEQVRARFKREARVMAKLTHPNAVTVHHSKLARDSAFIEMEYVRGQSLNKILKPGVPMPLDWVARMVEQLCDVLQAAHDLGIVHRDLKPSNLMLLDGRQPGKELLKVLDFGIAKILTSDGTDTDELRTQTNTFIGTAHYSSPEQIRGSKIDARSDLYSTGVILYEFLTGQRPFSGTAQMLICDHLTTPPSPFALKNPHCRVPEAVERVVLKCLSKDPDDRPQSARELSEEFLDAVQRSTTEGKGPSETRGQKWSDPGRTEAAPAVMAPVRQPTRQGSWRDASQAGSLSANAYDATENASVVQPHEYPGLTMTPKGFIPGVKKKKAVGPLITLILILPLLLLVTAVGIRLATRDGGQKRLREGEVPPDDGTTQSGKGSADKGKPYLLNANAKQFLHPWAMDSYRPVESEGTDDGWPRFLERIPEYIGAPIRYYLDKPTGRYYPEKYEPEGDLAEDEWPKYLRRKTDDVRFVRIPGGVFRLGTGDKVPMAPGDSSRPAHRVRITGFYIQEHEVTNREVNEYDRTLPAQNRLTYWQSYFKDALIRLPDAAPNHPATMLSHREAELCAAIYFNGLLPTEAQWEYAARSRIGLENLFIWDWRPADDPIRKKEARDLCAMNRVGEGEWPTVSVGTFSRTDVTKDGVIDMSGNVSEWCRDVMEPYQPDEDPHPRNPTGAKRSDVNSDDYVFRGGSVESIGPEELYATRRMKMTGGQRSPVVGFRLVLETPDSPGKAGLKP